MTVLNQDASCNSLLVQFLSTLDHPYSTCSLVCPRSNCISFLRNENYLHLLDSLVQCKISDLIVLIPIDLQPPKIPGISFYRTEDVDLLFTLYNNYARALEDPAASDILAEDAYIHPTAIIGSEGLSIVSHGGRRIQFKHCGRVVIENNVYIGAYSVIQRGRLDDTSIGYGTMISSSCVIGHNSKIGKNCTIAIHASISGSVVIGDNCWIGVGASIRNNISICNDVTVGVGSVVVKDILMPGTYAGNPCRLLYT